MAQDLKIIKNGEDISGKGIKASSQILKDQLPDLTMELLSNISKTRLVIMVSHNLQIVKEYSDRIIELSDGKVINDYRNKKVCRLDEIKQKLVEGNLREKYGFPQA